MTAEFTDLERSVLEAALAGDHPTLMALREQFPRCAVRERSKTGVGFFTALKVGADAPSAPTTRDRVHISDVVATIEGLQHGAGFVVFIQDGFLDLLEGFSYAGEPWPDPDDAFHIEYETGADRDLSSLQL